MLELRRLYHLVALAEYCHFGRTSRALGISQSAVSKSIQRLEADLGAKLFDRARKNVAPTAIGELVIERAQRLLAEAAQLEREVVLALGGEAGTVSVGVGPAMAEAFASTAIAHVAARHPRMRIHVRTDHSQQLAMWLFAGELDLFVADVTEIEKDPRVHVTHLPSEPFVWFCRRQHPLATARHVEREQLVEYPLVTPKMPPWAVAWFAEGEAPDTPWIGVETPATVECESYSMLKRMVMASDCISAALKSTIARELQAGDLVALPIEAPAIKTHAGIVRLRDRTMSPIAAETVREVLKAAQEHLARRRNQPTETGGAE